MKMPNHSITIMIISFLTLAFANSVFGQGDRIRGSQKAVVTQYIANDVQVTISYSRPAVKGRTIWGELVPYGLASGNKYSDNKPFPWRAGANENTIIEINREVKIEGKSLPAGKYSIHMIPSDKDWTVIFNTNSELWGSFKYNQEEDVLRVTVKPVKAPFQEWLIYGFDEITDSSATGYLHWEELKVPFKIEL